MALTINLKKLYTERIALGLMKHFAYKSSMQVPHLEEIVINQDLGMTTGDKKIIDVAIDELTRIAGQRAIVTHSRKDISNFELRKQMPIDIMVTLRGDRMYEPLRRPVCVVLLRIYNFKGTSSKLGGRDNYALGISEQIIFPEINLDGIAKILRMNITFVTSAPAGEGGFELLKHLGLPFHITNK